MHNDRFDALARLLDSLDTRRGALGLLGATLGLVGLAEADAANRKKKKKRKRRKRRRNQPFCKGKNTCTSAPTEAIFCDSRAECFCWVTADGGQPFCGSVPVSKGGCGLCGPGETCVRGVGTGIECGFDEGCVLPCANPLPRA
jgi:hypothetical protein